MWCHVFTDEAVHRGVGQEGIVGIGEHGHDVAYSGVAEASVEVAHHVRADVDGVDDAVLAHGLGEAHREVPGAGSDVGHHLALPKGQRGENLGGLLVLVASGVLERGDEGLGIAMAAMHLMGRRRFLGSGEPGGHGAAGEKQERLFHGSSPLFQWPSAATPSMSRSTSVVVV